MQCKHAMPDLVEGVVRSRGCRVAFSLCKGYPVSHLKSAGNALAASGILALRVDAELGEGR
jgi:hypothetical protein